MFSFRRVIFGLVVLCAFVVMTQSDAEAARRGRRARVRSPRPGGMLDRPNRPGHFVGNTVRFFYYRGR